MLIPTPGFHTRIAISFAIYLVYLICLFIATKNVFYFNLFADWVISFISVIHVLYIFCRATDK